MSARIIKTKKQIMVSTIVYTVLTIIVGVAAVLVTNYMRDTVYKGTDVSFYIPLTQASIIVSLVLFTARKWALTPYFNPRPKALRLFYPLAYLTVLSVPTVAGSIFLIKLAINWYNKGNASNAIFYITVLLTVLFLVYMLCYFTLRFSTFLCELALIAFSCGLPFTFYVGTFVLSLAYGGLLLGLTLILLPLILPALIKKR